MERQTPQTGRVIEGRFPSFHEGAPTSPAPELQGPVLDLSVDASETVALRKTLWGGSLIIELENSPIPLHPTLLTLVRGRLAGRSPLVWVEDGRLRIAFATYDNGDQERRSIEGFATNVAQLTGGWVSRAEIRPILALSTDSFLHAE